MTDQERLFLLKDAVKRYFALLDIVEETDEGRPFYPNRLGSCRCMDAPKMERALKEMKELCDIK